MFKKTAKKVKEKSKGGAPSPEPQWLGGNNAFSHEDAEQGGLEERKQKQKHEDEGDSKLDISPYVHPCCYLIVDLVRFAVLRHNLQKCPALFAKLSESQQVERLDLNHDTAHSLACFLETGEYHTLAKPGLSEAEQNTMEYGRSVLVYQAADTLQLPVLRGLAEEQIKKCDSKISLFEALGLAREVYEKLQDPDWYRDYLGAKIDEAFKRDEKLFVQDQFLQYIGKKETFSRLLVLMMAETYNRRLCDMDGKPSGKHANGLPPVTEGESIPAAPSSVPEPPEWTGVGNSGSRASPYNEPAGKGEEPVETSPRMKSKKCPEKAESVVKSEVETQNPVESVGDYFWDF